MAIQGLRDTSDFVTDQRPKNWREGVLMLMPNGTAPLFALSAAMKSEATDDPEFNWWEKSMQTRQLTITVDPLVGTTITFGGGGANALFPGVLLMSMQTREQMRVTSVTSDTVVEVTRSWGSVAATAVNPATSGVNPQFSVIGVVLEENSSKPTAISFDPVKKNNYTEIFRHNFGMSRTAMATRLRTGDQVKEAKRETLEIHSADIERALWFGEAVETTVNGHPARSTKGIYNFIPASNIETAAATTDLEALEGYLEQAFEYGSSQKMAFTGNRGMLILQQIIRKNTTYQLVTGEKEFGMNVQKLITPFGEIVLKTHPLFNQMKDGINTTAYQNVNSDITILDMANLKYRYLKDGDTKFIPKQEENGQDGMESGFLTECGLELHNPETHFQIRGLVAAAADT